MLRRVGVLAAVVAVAAGCASHVRETEQQQPAPRHLSAQPPRARIHRARAVPRKPVKLVVAVIDGDRNRRIRGARVDLWRRHDVTDRQGLAEIRVPWRRPLTVTVTARRYTRRVVYVTFHRSRKTTIRIYRPALQWPLYGANASRTQSQSQLALRPPFRVVWSRGLGGLIEFPAIVWDGVAYIGNARATIRAVSMRTGQVIWRHDTRGGELASSPAVAGNDLVYHGMDGWVYVLDRRTGRLRWRLEIGSPIESSPIVGGGLDYFGDWSGRVYGLDLPRHRIRWERSFGAKITSSASIVGGRLFIGDYAGRIWALDPRTGATRWVGGVNGRIYGTPAVAGGRVFVPSSDGRSLTAFTVTGRRLWSVYPGAYVYSSPAAWGGRVFFGSYNGVFYCVSASSGRILWEVPAGGSVSGAAVVVDGVAYAGSFGHEIVGVDARTGRVLLRFPHGYYVPVSGNGQRLLLHGFSRLYAVEPRAARHHERHARPTRTRRHRR